MLDHDERAALAHLADQRDRLRAFAGVHAGGRLVEQDHFRAARDRDPDFERALLGVAEHAGQHVAARGEPDLLHQPIRPFAGVAKALERPPEVVAVAERPQGRAAQVVEHRELGKDVGDLEAARQAAPVDLERLKAVDAPAVEPDLAGG